MEKISQHITLKEATFSQTAENLKINNMPGQKELEAMILVAEKCFEPLRAWYGKPIRINSFYRNAALNKAVKGSSTSQHLKGEAIDIDAGSRAENKKLFEWCRDNLVFDQLLWEYGNSIGPDWVHISYSKVKNRKQILIIK
jgi:hypothetical protein